MTDESKVRDTRASQQPDSPTEFHQAVTQMALKAIGMADNDRHLAALAKAYVVAGRAIRRVIVRAEMSNRTPATFEPEEVVAFVMEEDKADEKEGTGR